MLDWDMMDNRRSFSPPVKEFAIQLRDAMPEDLRRTLLTPFDARLSDLPDAAEIENARVALIAVETCRRVLSLTCIDVLDRPDLAELCRTAKDRPDVRAVCRQIRDQALAEAATRVKSSFHLTKALRRAAGAANYAIMGANEDFLPWIRQGRFNPAASGYSIHLAWAAFRKTLEVTFSARFPNTDYQDTERRYAVKYFTAATEILNAAILLGPAQ